MTDRGGKLTVGTRAIIPRFHQPDVPYGGQVILWKNVLKIFLQMVGIQISVG
jgi:hypothetical protein